MIFGTFDLLHPGHHFLVNEARKRGDVTVVVARSSNVERIKGKATRESDAERAHALEAAFPDVKVVLGDTADFLQPVREHVPDLLLFGYDQKLPPGVTEADLPCPIERAEAFQPERFKSSLMKKKGDSRD